MEFSNSRKNLKVNCLISGKGLRGRHCKCSILLHLTGLFNNFGFALSTKEMTTLEGLKNQMVQTVLTNVNLLFFCHCKRQMFTVIMAGC